LPQAHQRRRRRLSITIIVITTAIILSRSSRRRLCRRNRNNSNGGSRFCTGPTVSTTSLLALGRAIHHLHPATIYAYSKSTHSLT